MAGMKMPNALPPAPRSAWPANVAPTKPPAAGAVPEMARIVDARHHARPASVRLGKRPQQAAPAPPSAWSSLRAFASALLGGAPAGEPPFRFEALPSDVQRLVVEHMDDATAKAMGQTSRHGSDLTSQRVAATMLIREAEALIADARATARQPPQLVKWGLQAFLAKARDFGAIVRLLGAPGDGQANAGSGMFGIRSGALRKPVAVEVGRVLDFFACFERKEDPKREKRDWPEVSIQVGDETNFPPGRVFAALARLVNSSKDIDAVLGTPGGVGILALEPEQQRSALQALIERIGDLGDRSTAAAAWPRIMAATMALPDLPPSHRPAA